MNKSEVIILLSSDDESSVDNDAIIISKKRPRTKDESPARKKINNLGKDGNSERPQSQRQRHVLLYLNDKNECVVTEGLMESLRKIISVRCCLNYTENGRQEHNCPGNNSSSCSSKSFHIQQKDKWSCGFRNMQMILTSILPFLGPDHSFWRYSSTETSTFDSASLEIPSVLELQCQMESAWKEGFDADGAQHYGNVIVGKAVWIGAVEVASLFSYMGIDATVVQFIRCPESRQQLVPFCIAYFQRNHCTTSFCALYRLSSMQMVQKLLQGTNGSVETTNLLEECQCTCDVPPLYLQWNGHSVCVVGYEVDGTNKDIHLLAFDPMKRGSVLEISLQKHQVEPFRLTRTKLERQDCQIVVCSTLALQGSARERIKQCLQTATAAESAVLQTIKKTPCK